MVDTTSTPYFLPQGRTQDEAGLEDPDVHGGVVLGDALVHECGAQGDQGGGADPVKDLGEDEQVLVVGEVAVSPLTLAGRGLRLPEGPLDCRRWGTVRGGRRSHTLSKKRELSVYVYVVFFF